MYRVTIIIGKLTARARDVKNQDIWLLRYVVFFSNSESFFIIFDEVAVVTGAYIVYIYL